MGLVDVRTILCDNSWAESRERVTGKPVAVSAESRREGGPTTLDLTKWDFNKADCRNKCIKLVENSKALLLIGSPIDSGRENRERGSALGIHLRVNCTEVGISFTHTHILQTVGHSQQLRIS